MGVKEANDGNRQNKKANKIKSMQLHAIPPR